MNRNDDEDENNDDDDDARRVKCAEKDCTICSTVVFFVDSSAKIGLGH